MSNTKHSTTKNLSDFKVNNFIFCEALNCSKYATEKINVNVGKYGNITLNLCQNCIHIFKKETVNAVKDNSKNKVVDINDIS